MLPAMRNWLLIALLAAPAAFADPADYQFDPVHSQVVFYADHLGFSHSIGRFAAPTGAFRFDPEDWTSASVDAQNSRKRTATRFHSACTRLCAMRRPT